MSENIELQALNKINDALNPLAEEERIRVLDWALAKFAPSRKADRMQHGHDAEEQEESAASRESFDDLSELFAAADPSNGPEAAMVVSYWLQVVRGQESVTGHEVNKELAHLGHRASNITDAFTSLKGRKPALALQVQKSGKSRQGRKKYKLTTAGIKATEDMLGGSK